MLLSYKPVHLQGQQRLQEEGCVVDIKLISGAVAGRLGKGRSLTPRQLSPFLAPLPGRLVLEGISLDLAIESFSFLFYH